MFTFLQIFRLTVFRALFTKSSNDLTLVSLMSSVGCIISVPVRAVGFCFPELSSIASAYILNMRDRFKVKWINAILDSAKMVKFFTIGNRPYKDKICDTVGAGNKAMAIETAVPATMSTCPYPALPKVWRIAGDRAIKISLVPNAFFNTAVAAGCSRMRLHLNLLSGVMPPAVPAARGLPMYFTTSGWP